MFKTWADKVNGYGVLFRFLTPTLIITIGIFIITSLKTDINQVKMEAQANFDKLQAVAQVNFDKIDIQLSNHLSHHTQFDKEIFERLSVIETKIKR
jgi:hypothetical protein